MAQFVHPSNGLLFPSSQISVSKVFPGSITPLPHNSIHISTAIGLPPLQTNPGSIKQFVQPSPFTSLPSSQASAPRGLVASLLAFPHTKNKETK
jgi:hypothetical protein